MGRPSIYIIRFRFRTSSFKVFDAAMGVNSKPSGSAITQINLVCLLDKTFVLPPGCVIYKSTVQPEQIASFFF